MKCYVMILMSALIVISKQQRHGELMWLSPYSPSQPVVNNYQRSQFYDPVETDVPYFRFSRPIRPTIIDAQDDEDAFSRQFANQNLFAGVQNPLVYLPEQPDQQSEEEKSGRLMPVVVQHSTPNRNRMANVIQPRFKNYQSYFQDSPSDGQAQNRFYVNSDSTYNPLLRTVTLRVTSTCTSLSLVSCIPAASLPAAPVPACRRKRNNEIDQSTGEEETQFPINPTQVESVTPTVQPLPAVPNDAIQTPSIEMISSKEEEVNSDQFAAQLEKQERKAKFLHWKNYFTSTTTTSWVVVSSTLTQTFVPAVALACLPPGFLVC
ncbi:hypothetical protein GHT06_015634 [Daphnia sinensis]|uniref:Uncharacterized protein n=1 Tax=Daphnia sinensis TaxID=1820382 RepID=A0AAD5LBH3_9CRUS|nr:hypothetical protein GHT06_015634 [Daphnia sinensis]